MDEKLRISGKTRFGGLIGQGISHSLSPLIHNSSAALLGLDLVYLPFDFAEAPPKAFFEAMLRANCYGFNVTLPFKETTALTLKAANSVELSSLSCNTLIPRGTQWEMTSTDADGFIAGLKEIGKKLEDFSAFIFMGYGGAAKALVAKVRQLRPQQPLVIMQRNRSAELQIDGHSILQANFDPLEFEALLKLHPESLVIQCTSAPLRGDDLSRFCPALKGFKGTFVDLVYGSPSALLSESHRLGIACQDGIPMLIHQALLSQKLWWGQSASFSDIKTALARQR